MVTVKETPYIDNPNKEAHWLIDETTVNDSWWELVYSLIGYILLALIVRSSYKMGVFKKHLHDVFLILFFALFTDIVEFRIHLLVVFDLQYRGDYYGNVRHIPTTVASCTIAVNLIYAHFMITYVEAIIAIHRFIVRFCGKSIPVSFVYIPLGIVVALKVLYLLVSLKYGQPFPAFAGHCTRTFSIPIFWVFNILAWLCTILIAPLLSVPIIIRELTSRKSDGVSVFILLSSLMMAIFVINYMVLGFGVLQDLHGILYTILRITGKFHSYRFVFLCVLAVVLVGDIRDAVVATLKDTIRKATGRPVIPTSINNDQFMEMDGKTEMTENI